MEHETAPDTSPLQRVLAYAGLTLIVLSIISLGVSLAAASGVLSVGDLTREIVIGFPIFALPIGFLLIIALLVISIARRGRDNRRGAR